jgi:hypothetical protein
MGNDDTTPKSPSRLRKWRRVENDFFEDDTFDSLVKLPAIVHTPIHVRMVQMVYSSGVNSRYVIHFAPLPSPGGYQLRAYP